MLLVHGDAKLDTWLADYLTAFDTTGGDELQNICYLSLVLIDTARVLLHNLPKDSIYDMCDFEKVLPRNFSRTYKRPHN